ncbi:uncharacterized protein LOC127790070 [Diospyros lotus]|uniref:uncharacterized protein LOC127790070 n=1 Tax=Diospyros lotus TaxID=55363 RepID=UPI002250824C|nr:uncharacterized protein LOC127790070 [Diospyros lotus]
MANQLESLVESIKSKVRSLKQRNSKKKKKLYARMDKSASAKARDLIDKTLKVADRPGKRTIS